MFIQKILVLLLIFSSLSHCLPMEQPKENKISDANEFFFHHIKKKIITQNPQKRVNVGSNFEIILAYIDCIDKPLITKAIVIENYATKHEILKFYELKKECFDRASKPSEHFLYNTIWKKQLEFIYKNSSSCISKYIVVDQTHPDYLFNYKNSFLFTDISDKFQSQLAKIQNLVRR